MRVLFVDDETQVLQGLRRLLFPRRNRWQLAFAEGGAEALAMLSGEAFDVVVSDVRMPRMDGVELLANARERHPQLARILLSGQVDPEAALRAPAVAHRFLSKPCDAEELIAVLEQAEHLSHQPRLLRELVAGASGLPSKPAHLQELQERLATPAVIADDVVTIIQQDAALSAKILQLVSSSFLGPARPGSDVGAAVEHIGLDRLHQLLGCTDIFHVAEPHPADGRCDQGAEHGHEARGGPPLPGTEGRGPGPAATASVLQDVGILLLAARAPERLSANLAECAASGEPLAAVEQRNDGFTHADVGGALLALWGLPAEVAEMVRTHHDGGRSSPASPPSPITHVRTMEEVA